MRLTDRIKNFFRDEEARRLLKAIVVKLDFLRKEVNKQMSELQAKIEQLETKVATLEQTVVTEIQQVRTILEQNNDVQGAIERLTNLEARIGAVTTSVSEIVPDESADPIPDAQPPLEEPSGEQPSGESTE